MDIFSHAMTVNPTNVACHIIMFLVDGPGQDFDIKVPGLYTRIKELKK